MAHYDVFRQQLAIRCPAYGYGLWEPTPGEHYPTVQVGDVGFIRRGKFHRLFNALLPADHPSHQRFGVPEYHEPLEVGFFPHIDMGTLNPNNFRSADVQGGPVGGGVFAAGPDWRQLAFSCSRAGAVLSLPLPARSQDTLALGEFRRWMITHIDLWFAFTQSLGLGITRMEDIVLVTGCHLASSFANIAFSDVRGEEHVSFEVQVPDASRVEWRFPFEDVQGVALNYGPSGQNLPEHNCIFIRGYRATRLLGILPRLRGAAEPTQGPNEDEPQLNMNPVTTSSDIKIQDPLDMLLEYIKRQAPDCDIALVHDDDLVCIEESLLEALRSDEVMNYLRKSAPRVRQFQCAGTPSIKVATLDQCSFETPIAQDKTPPHGVPSTRGQTEITFPFVLGTDSTGANCQSSFPYHNSQQTDTPSETTFIYPPATMNDDSRLSSRYRGLFESALRDYERQTGMELAKHPLAMRLNNCHTVKSIVGVLRKQVLAFSDGDRIVKSLERIILILHTLSNSAVLGEGAGIALPPVKAIHAGLAILFSTVQYSKESLDLLIDLLEAIEHLLDHLHIYTSIPPTAVMDEVILKIMVELLSTLALVTKQITEKQPVKFAKKLLRENHIDAVLQRLDRLTLEEARRTGVQTLEVVYGLIQNMREVMGDGKVSVDGIRNVLELLHQIAGDLNRSTRDKLQHDIRNWLSPPDPWKNHYIACESRYAGTALWFIQGDILSDWKSKSSGPSSLLWIHGKTGSGKSVLCSAIIQDIDAMQNSGLASLAFYYCDFREDQKKDRHGLLSSLLVQLCHQSNSYSDILSRFYLEHASGSKQPSDDALARCLKELLRVPDQAPVYLILDALDECPNTSALPSPREKVLKLVEELIDSRISNLRICLTSRPETDIKGVLGPLSFRSISLHDETGQIEDINFYIKSVVTTDSIMRKWTAEDKQLVIDALTAKADGMFMWAYCQLVNLRKCLPARIPNALAELPGTLNEIYGRSLREIESNWEYAHRLFQCVTVASRPLRVEELAEFLAFDFEARPIPKFHRKLRLKDPVYAVLSTCSSLLSVVNVEGSPIVQFSHLSVKEFLTSTRLAEIADHTIRRYHISMISAHTLAAQACLGILLHLDKNITRGGLRDFPLAEYAAKHWVDHVRSEQVMPNVEEGVKYLFDPNKPHLATWVWIYDPAELWHTNERGERPSHPSGTPLHYAAVCGLHAMVTYLISEHSMDVNARGIYKGSTPLHQASDKGHVEAVRVLLEYGADVTAQNEDKLTPLHRASRSGRGEVVPLLLDHGADAAAQDKNRMTPLHWASYRGHADVVRILLDHGKDLTALDKDGWTPLHWASFEGRVDVARVLLEHGADVRAQDNSSKAPLHLASSEGYLKVVRLLLEYGADAKAQDIHGWTPLHRASSEGRADVARILLEHGVDPTVQAKDGRTALHLASRGGHVEVTTLLLKHGTSMIAKDKEWSTPLHLASHEGKVEIVRVLLKHGADTTVRDKNGSTPLHRASEEGHAEVTRVLLGYGAAATVEDADGSTPLHLASRGGHVEIVRALLKHGVHTTAQDKHGRTPLHGASYWERVEVASALLEHRVDVMHVMLRDRDGWTPLHLASYWGRAEAARVLLEHGVDATVLDGGGSTPLHLASQGGHADVVRVLLKYKANARAQDEHGRTPLHRASCSEYVDVARMLLEHGADATARAKDGWTPLHLASRGGHVEMVRILVKQGADATAQATDGWTPLRLASSRGHHEVVHILQTVADPLATTS